MGTLFVTNTNDTGDGSLRDAIKNANTGDTIEFSPNLRDRTITLTSPLQIDAGSDLTIDGDASNLTISGNNRTRILKVDSNQDFTTELTVKNLTLAQGYTNERGGAISTEYKGSIAVLNVSFENNVADGGGGAIDIAWEGNLEVNDSRFEGNRATGDNDERGGGAISFLSPGDLSVINSDFIGNEGINGGAINSLNGNMTIADSEFIDNQTTAAIYDTGNKNPFLRGFGGAIFADRASSKQDTDGGAIEIDNSTFQNNQGRGEGGAVYLYTGGKDRVSIDGTTFENNEVKALPNGGNNGHGGAVVVMSNEVNRGLTITDSSFVENTAAGQGGGLWQMNAPTTIDNVEFLGNRVESFAYSGVGGAMALYGQTDIANTTIANNYAGWVGGGISADENPVSVKNTFFYRNTADNGNEDWGIQQHTNRELIDKGGNTQYPVKQTNNFNDVNATARIKILASDPGINSLNTSSVDTLNKNEIIVGNSNDTLTGTANNDRFIFNDLNWGTVTIDNFDPVNDELVIGASGIRSGLNLGELPRDRFLEGISANDVDDRFIYDRDRGSLYFDSDGSGALPPVLMAIFNDRASLTNADIVIES
jgi:Chlamydia polymorphic membrane protein (Chlamydia_PMP) repeat